MPAETCDRKCPIKVEKRLDLLTILDEHETGTLGFAEDSLYGAEDKI